ncbi:ankyrin repeat domain-containing protein [Pandoraea sp. ISTKB]|uniref:ankyrin repeat domain-containing protein n=1 Tax=Pandoraea sp. ISTKB TaxID=1586708 RepID=UPI000846D60F|nr:ankyrin repeat domain-containing protein [Pandoraea sp. ISTKB]ODP34012.1 hypothetical protein A9762_02740 [Pandoraea sp. ISTKB]
MKRLLGWFVLAITPCTSFAQYDYNDDFTKAIATHYPPLVRLLITKGGKQNTQDANGDTPMMLAIRSRDREIADLLTRYGPDYSLQNTAHHTAAIEAVLANDADSLSTSLIRGDMFQVAQAAALAKKMHKRRAYDKLSEMLGAPVVDEISSLALTSNMRSYLNVGNTVSLSYSPPGNVPDLCGKPQTVFLFQGKVCRVDGNSVSVEWQSVSNLNNADMSCSPQHHFRLERSADAQRNSTYLGNCGSAPAVFSALPSTFDYKQFLIPELR